MAARPKIINKLEEMPTIQLPDDFNWPMLTDIYDLIIKSGLPLCYGAVKLVLPQHFVDQIVPDNNEELQKRIEDALGTGKFDAKKTVLKRHGDHFLFSYSKQLRTVRQCFNSNETISERAFWEKLRVTGQVNSVYLSDLNASLLNLKGGSPIGPVLNAYVACERKAKGDPNARILEGVCTPFLYFGSAGTIFGIHQEDEDICAWNLQLYGANKDWYAIPAADMPRVKGICARNFPDDHRRCNAPLRHKNFFLDVDRLLAEGIRVCRTQQSRGAIVLSFPGAAHQGINEGFNVNEAVNFACWDSIPFALDAIPCDCGGEHGPVNFHRQELLGRYLERHEPALYRRWMAPNNDQPFCRYYAPFHLRSESGPNVQGMMSDQPEHAERFPTANFYWERVCEYQKLASQTREFREVLPLHGLNFIFDPNAVSAIPPIDVAETLSEAETIAKGYRPDLACSAPPRVIDPLPRGLSFEGRAYRYEKNDPRNNVAYYRCLRPFNNCAVGCNGRIGILPENFGICETGRVPIKRYQGHDKKNEDEPSRKSSRF